MYSMRCSLCTVKVYIYKPDNADIEEYAPPSFGGEGFLRTFCGEEGGLCAGSKGGLSCSISVSKISME